jgi:Spy/CpxP family protein refolding chaperone
MRTWALSLVAAVMTIGLLAGSALARPHLPGGGNSNPPPEQAFSGEYREMIDVTKFTPAQRESLHKLLEEHDKAIKDNDAAKLDAAKAQVSANTDDDRKAADEKMKNILAQRDAIEHTMKVKAFEIMTPDQKVIWTAYKLEKFFVAELSGLDPKLDDTQKTQLKALCQTDGAKTPSPDVAGDTKLLDSVRKDISAKVLTDQQRTNYDKLLDAKDKAKEDKDKKDKAAADKAKDAGTDDKSKDTGADDKPKPTDDGAGPTTKTTGPLNLDVPQP